MRLENMLWGAAACVLAAPPLFASEVQTPADRADPSVLEKELNDAPSPPRPSRTIVDTDEAPISGSEVTEPVLASAIRVDNAIALPQAAFAGVVGRYAGRTLTAAELRTLAADIAAVARTAGYGLATAWVPAQQVENGILRVRIDEGSIDAVEVSGSGRAAVVPRLQHLADGKPLLMAELERRLLIAGDLPGIRLGKARLVRKNGRNVLVVASELRRVEGVASMDNWGSSTSGPVRTRLSVDVNALLASDDRLSVDAVLTPLQPREFGLVRAAYTASIGTDGTEVSVGGYAARSEAGGALADRDLDGKSTELNVAVRHPIVRSRDASLWAEVSGKTRSSEQSRQNELVRKDRLSTLTASLYGSRRFEGGRLRGHLAFVQGLDVLGATQAGDPLASRADADGTFSKLEFGGEFEHRLGYDFNMFLQVEAQLAGGSLLSSEEMGLGGRWFGRAWDFREFSGDRGIAGSLELRYDWTKPMGPLEAAQLYAYLDGGAVANLDGGTGGGSLASAGLGFRLWLPHAMRGSLQLGIPLAKSANGTGDPRVSATLEKRF
jgi:hemolysin activation/secretion protein